MSAAADELYEPNDVRPVIETGSSGNWGLYAFLALLAVGGIVLFSALSASRNADESGAILQPTNGERARLSSPEPLTVPPRFLDRENVSPRSLEQAQTIRELPQPSASLAPVRVTQVPTNPAEVPPSPAQRAAPVFLPEPPRARVVFENSVPPAASVSAAPPAVAVDPLRVTADRLANPSQTIPQGTVIPAVLETALDSTRGGGVRALVQRDVSGFDGTRVLIPRGSRLYGEYEANLQPGQNRALVQWTRLIRPDGVTIALDSPSSDPLGRAGVRGKVDSKFFQRFGNALLQSVLDIGVGLAINSATDGVIVALPGSTQNVQVSEEQRVLPTLKVKHGTSVSVFVARDLDFSSVER